MSPVRRMSIALAAAVLALATHSAVAVAVAAEESLGDRLQATLSDGGAEMAATVDWASRPEYALWAKIEPGTGEVGVLMMADLPVGEMAGEIRLRWFPGVVADDASIASVTVDGVAAGPVITGSLVTVPLAPAHAGSVHVIVAFAFTAPLFVPPSIDPLSSGNALQPADIGLLARTDGAVMLGHWFPTWIPDGLDADSELDGYGDISNFPAATISAVLDVPESSTVVTGGVRLGEATTAGRAVYTEGAVGVRDLAVVVMSDADQVETRIGDVDVVVTAPAGTPDVDTVADLTGTAVDTLSAGLGAYPWDELDVVSVPLGSGVAGMEWPGMVWIESSLFEGGIPGLGDLGIDMDEITELLGPDVLGTDGGLGDVLGSDGDMFGLGDLGLAMGTMREWTISHEVGHMWWHALVGNDSITAPVIDEALAQHSACLVERELRPADADEICDVNTAGQFRQLVALMGVGDAPADQPTDGFDSSMQYGAVVYGKAPMFYRELEERYGVDETTAALAAVVAEYAFDQVTPDELRAALGESLGDPSGVDELWQHWMDEAHGADDLPN